MPIGVFRQEYYVTDVLQIKQYLTCVFNSGDVLFLPIKTIFLTFHFN